MTQIKICGLREVEHVLTAAAAGANFIGMIFAESRRRVSLERASAIAEFVHRLEHPPEVVGVFVNSPASEVNRIARACHLDRVQFSGEESYDYCLEIPYPIIKVIHISGTSKAEEILDRVAEGYHRLVGKKVIYILDSQKTGAYGGTGELFNWELAKGVCARFPVIIAGGLNPANVGTLVKEVSPWGVDVSSGVEENGRKSSRKIREFITAVRSAENR